MFASLRVVTPPAQEPVTLDMVKSHCRVDSDYDDAALTMYATSARIWAEEYLNRALITQELLYNITSSPPPTASPLVPQSLIVFPLNWPPHIRKPIALPRSRVQSLVSFNYGEVGDMQPADPDDYILNLDVEPAQIMIASPLVPMIPAQSAALDYICGYGDDPEDVPMPIRHAILVLTAFLYENRGDVPGDMPNTAWNLLTPFRLWQFAG
jgi:uncharacterized phiE125 gp8 family phage protein